MKSCVFLYDFVSSLVFLVKVHPIFFNHTLHLLPICFPSIHPSIMSSLSFFLVTFTSISHFIRLPPLTPGLINVTQPPQTLTRYLLVLVDDAPPMPFLGSAFEVRAARSVWFRSSEAASATLSFSSIRQLPCCWLEDKETQEEELEGEQGWFLELLDVFDSLNSKQNVKLNLKMKMKMMVVLMLSLYCTGLELSPLFIFITKNFSSETEGVWNNQLFISSD